MAPYKVALKPSVEKDLRSLPQSVISRVFKQIEALGNEPFPRQSKSQRSWLGRNNCIGYA